jgi:isopropylmalate/homocitrate/citramalate synthase
MLQFLVPLTSSEATDAGRFGPKAANLARLGLAGLPRPGGFCLGAEAYRTQVRALGLDADASGVFQKLSGHAVPSNRSVVGDSLFQIESGIIASWSQNCGDQHPTELFPYHWDLVGQPTAKVVLGNGSGTDSIKAALKHLGVEFTEEEALKVVAAVTEFSLEHKRLLTSAEFDSIVSKALPVRVGAG